MGNHQMRKFNIGLTNSFAITQDIYAGKDIENAEGMDAKPFATITLVEGKIAEIVDSRISSGHIEFIKNEPMFYEVCDFTVWDMDKKIDRFQGSFIDAMMWLVNNKKECVTPELREKLKLS